MSYDQKGLGFAELTFLAFYWPDTFETILSAPEGEILALARKFLSAFNQGLLIK